MEDVKQYMDDVAKATLFILVLICLSKMISSSSGYGEKEGHLAKTLVLESKNWLDLSSDGSPAHKIESVSYSRNSLNIARQIMKDSLLEQVSGMDIHALDKAITTRQREVKSNLK